MLADDLTAIRNHFLDTLGSDTTLQIVMANQPGAQIDEKQLWSRFTIAPKDCTPYSRADVAYYEQLGLVMLQVFVPNGLGTGDGYILADRFLAAFRDWRSDDNITRAYKSTMTTQTNADNFQITAMVFWSSIREG